MIYKPTRRAKEINSIIVNLKKPYHYQTTAKKINDAIKRTLERLSSKNKT